MMDALTEEDVRKYLANRYNCIRIFGGPRFHLREYIRIECLRGFRHIHVYFHDVGGQETDELHPKSSTEA